ncbi:hypothetical protein FOA52_006659 [Chlamydomonas sp. UWO 241]|nr:hypothetical protein FOA52_006659 [Chlamydomonas sp. UWO 241]
MLHRCVRALQQTLHAASPAYAHRFEARGQGGVRGRGACAAAGAAAGTAAGTAAARPGGGQPQPGRQPRASPQVARAAHRADQVGKAMEVEVKIRLPDRTAYDKIAAVLAPGLVVTHEQENFFFDSSAKQLEAQRAVLRLRFYDVDRKAVVTVKGKQILEGGIGRATEVEEPLVDAAGARRFLDTPTDLLSECPLLVSLNAKLCLSDLVCMGGFRNRRQEYAWEGFTLELDETYFEHGTLYEIEVETDQPEVARDRLEKLLSSHGISYSYSPVSKFANFINKSLL